MASQSLLGGGYEEVAIELSAEKANVVLALDSSKEL
jgi:hypothetical protein